MKVVKRSLPILLVTGWLFTVVVSVGCEDIEGPIPGKTGILFVGAGTDEEYSPHGMPNYFYHLYPFFPVGFFAGGDIEGNTCYTLIHYANEAEAATCGVEIGTPIDVFCDVYEKLDEYLITSPSIQFAGDGVLYKAVEWEHGATRFETLQGGPSEYNTWDGWEQIYPESPLYWDPLEKLRRCIVWDDDASFRKEITRLYDLDNAVNYFLLINLIGASDNIGKNQYLSRYAGSSKFYAIPWDLDASWGRQWDMSPSSTEGIISNRLYDRLIATNTEGFKEKLVENWLSYRQDIFSVSSLRYRVQSNHTLLENTGAYERENTRWKGFGIDPKDEYAYVMEWMEARLAYLDDFFMHL